MSEHKSRTATILAVLLIFLIMATAFGAYSYFSKPYIPYAVTIKAVNGAGAVISNVEIYLDGKLVGTGSVQLQNVSIGQHTISFQSISGYVTPDPITFNHDFSGKTNNFIGVYQSQGYKVYTVIVLCEEYLYGKDNGPVSDAIVYVKNAGGNIVGASTNPTGSDGTTSIQLPEGSYTLYAIVFNPYDHSSKTSSETTLVVTSSNSTLTALVKFNTSLYGLGIIDQIGLIGAQGWPFILVISVVVAYMLFSVRKRKRGSAL